MSQRDTSTPFATGGGLEILKDLQTAAPDTMIGQRLGDYRITGLLAVGGMSRVYRGERVDGSFERAVAIKVSLQSGFDEGLRESFQREQNVLAGLNHPHIAQLLDAQVTAEGWPCIVMELVDAGPIDAYCRDRQLGQRQRIRLLLNVLDAVAYAHARLVVHRDIKPSNVLVSEEGRPKLLDFGIAKLLQAAGDEQTQQQLLTPRYASPEQLLGQTITIASDIYQLGLLILEVLTGEAVNSTETPAEALQRTSAGRDLEIRRELWNRLGPELGAVVGQCLRAEPERRYSDVNALRADLEAYLAGRPVAAVGNNRRYRLGKFVKRNRAIVSVSATALLVVVLSTVWYTTEVTRQRNEAQAQRALADESLRFVVSFFEASDPVTAQGRDLTASEILDQGSARVAEELADQPQIQARLFFEIGASRFYRGEAQAAAEQARLALNALSRVEDPDPLDSLSFRNLLGNALSNQGRMEEALEVIRSVHEDALTVFGPDHPLTLGAQNNLAATHWQLGQLDAALTVWQENYAEKVRVFGRDAERTLATAVNLATVYGSLDRIDEQYEQAREGLALSERVLGPKHLTTLNFINNLANAALVRDGPDTAIPLLEDTAQRYLEVFGADSHRYQSARAILGAAYGDAGDPRRGAPMQQEAIALMTEQLGAEHPDVLDARSTYASTLSQLDRHEEARAALEEVMELQTRVLGPTHHDTAYTRVTYVAVLASLDDPRAGSIGRPLLAELEDALGAGHRHVRRLREILERRPAAAD